MAGSAGPAPIRGREPWRIAWSAGTRTSPSRWTTRGTRAARPARSPRARPRPTASSASADAAHARHDRTTMPVSTIHIEPTSTGRWIVRHDDEHDSLSEHWRGTDAQSAARYSARSEGASVVLLHDRYARVHRVRIDGRRQRDASGHR